ncbi:hypothetical protein [Ornithinimicrobium pratense]|uniref:Uncharacterized protein n=1 Tax=Ornithinimicrobium pratense TaxID=2593973 RepID=A0A5J6V4G3_9MICO|nr:hypothetical protein [Ornithinimicrobium pratense]QFG68870.1 hypothetical protein FY030_09305 [Ornithinimicrobium pratense]
MNENFREALERAAGDNPHVDLTEQVWAQGRVVRRRRQTVQAAGGLTAAAALVGAMWLGGGLLSDPDAFDGPADQPTSPAVTSVEDEAPDGPTEGENVDGPATEDPGTDATGEDVTTEDPGTDATGEDLTTEDPAPAGPIDPCGTAYPDPVLVAEGLPEATTDRALEVLELAAACDLDGLAALAQQDDTHLSFGVASPQEAFSGDKGAERAAAVTTLLTRFEPGQDAPDAPYRWPAEVETEQDWARLVDSGLYAQQDVDLMRGSGIGYSGWRVGVDASGRWAFLVAGE